MNTIKVLLLALLSTVFLDSAAKRSKQAGKNKNTAAQQNKAKRNNMSNSSVDDESDDEPDDDADDVGVADNKKSNAPGNLPKKKQPMNSGKKAPDVNAVVVSKKKQKTMMNQLMSLITNNLEAFVLVVAVSAVGVKKLIDKKVPQSIGKKISGVYDATVTKINKMRDKTIVVKDDKKKDDDENEMNEYADKNFEKISTLFENFPVNVLNSRIATAFPELKNQNQIAKINKIELKPYAKIPYIKLTMALPDGTQCSMRIKVGSGNKNVALFNKESLNELNEGDITVQLYDNAGNSLGSNISFSDFKKSFTKNDQQVTLNDLSEDIAKSDTVFAQWHKSMQDKLRAIDSQKKQAVDERKKQEDEYYKNNAGKKDEVANLVKDIGHQMSIQNASYYIGGRVKYGNSKEYNEAGEKIKKLKQNLDGKLKTVYPIKENGINYEVRDSQKDHEMLDNVAYPYLHIVKTKDKEDGQGSDDLEVVKKYKPIIDQTTKVAKYEEIK